MSILVIGLAVCAAYFAATMRRRLQEVGRAELEYNRRRAATLLQLTKRTP